MLYGGFKVMKLLFTVSNYALKYTRYTVVTILIPVLANKELAVSIIDSFTTRWLLVGVGV